MCNKYFDRYEYAKVVDLIEKANTLSYKNNFHLLQNMDVNKICVNIPPVDPIYKNKLTWHDSFELIISYAKSKGLLNNAIVHGSFGDFSFTEFSDLEVTIFLNSNIFLKTDKILELRRWIKKSLNPLLFKIDPLQHHGPFYLWPDLINAYGEDILPIAAYKKCWAFEPLHLNFGLLNLDSTKDTKPFYNTLHSIKNHEQTFFKHGVTPYSIKRFLSNIMLLPAFYYQSKGDRFSKKKAINSILALEIEPIRTVLTLSTNYRNEWKKPPAWLGWLRKGVGRARIPSGRIDLIITSLYRDKNLQKNVKKELLPRINHFCRTFEELAKFHEIYKCPTVDQAL